MSWSPALSDDAHTSGGISKDYGIVEVAMWAIVLPE